MRPTISIGTQDFAYLRKNNCFYVDKTDFIREWWENQDAVTLITRPRRFGKTLNMNMMELFFSNLHRGRSDLFEGLSVWQNENYHALQGSYPVISFSFANVKETTYAGARDGIVGSIQEAYRKHEYLLKGNTLSENERKHFQSFGKYMMDTSPDRFIPDAVVTGGIKDLAFYLNRYYGKRVLIFLDEYDTPLQEAYVNGYWEEMTALIRTMFNSTFKTDPYMERGLMTGITRVGKESIFSDLNNLEVVTITSSKYETVFGFTEDEVAAALGKEGLSEKLPEVKRWYDGFCFGRRKDIFNPWSITKYLDSGKTGAYWANTSGNQLVNKLLQSGTPEMKLAVEDLLEGKQIETPVDEEIIFSQLEENEEAVWSLLLASGYLKADEVPEEEELYHLSLTNLEVLKMFRKMIRNWFGRPDAKYNDFIKALLANDVDYMNEYMNQMTLTLFGSFDTGTHPSEKAEPERFYHGFVLGLLADPKLPYQVLSNRESGLGRYDVVLKPENIMNDAYIFEFKVRDTRKERSLEDTVQTALRQIKEKKYDAGLIAEGILKEKIRHYGFAFEGKKVLIGC